MTPAEQGFLLLTSQLGDPERKPLTIAQFRDLAKRARTMEKPLDSRELSQRDLVSIGCNCELAKKVILLLSQTEQLNWYVEKGKRSGCVPVTRNSDRYPHRLRRSLAFDAPGVLWLKGDPNLLERPCISLVGSRELRMENRGFAAEVGKQAALQGFVLVSGHARGADRTAQESCLAHGGNVISVVCDELERHVAHNGVLYLSEDGFDMPFSAQRALQRNRVIHSLGEKTFVAQSAYGRGGTWDGTQKNLRYGWSPVFCFDDGSQACCELQQMGAVLIGAGMLTSIVDLRSPEIDFLEP